jgi:hypothetical protein
LFQLLHRQLSAVPSWKVSLTSSPFSTLSRVFLEDHHFRDPSHTISAGHRQ